MVVLAVSASFYCVDAPAQQQLVGAASRQSVIWQQVIGISAFQSEKALLTLDQLDVRCYSYIDVAERSDEEAPFHLDRSTAHAVLGESTMAQHSIQPRAVSLTLAVLLGIAGLATLPSATAAPILTLDDGQGNTTTVEDTNGDGFLMFMGNLGSFTINMVTGLSAPAIGGGESASLDILSLNVSGGNGGTLTISLSDTFSIPDLTGITTSIGGVTSGDITFQSFVDGALQESFDFTGSLWGTAFSDQSQFGLGPLPDPFTLAIVATITHEAFDTTSFNGTATVHAPEPMTLTLVGSGLLLGGFVRKRYLKAVGASEARNLRSVTFARSDIQTRINKGTLRLTER